MDVADCTDASKHKTAPIPLVVYISFQIVRFKSEHGRSSNSAGRHFLIGSCASDWRIGRLQVNLSATILIWPGKQKQ
jgi:hypothetical protein